MCFSFYEVAWAQRESILDGDNRNRPANLETMVDAFIRDELSKGRYDPAISKICFEMLLELFNRALKLDLGPRAGGEQVIEDVC